MSEAEEIHESPGRRPKKTIIYSDKSESSIDELMGDTPSNYNLPNGRLEGKSLGLKVFLMNQQRNGAQTLDPGLGPQM